MPIYNWQSDKHLDSEVLKGGLLITVRVGVDALLDEFAAGKDIAVPPPIEAPAMFDTGCTTTAIDNHLAEQLGLIPRGVATVASVRGKGQMPRYAFSLALNPDLRFPYVYGLGCDLEGQDVQVLIGMDILSRGVFIVDGTKGSVTFAI